MSGELVSQLGVIEQQPLEQRAEGYAQLAAQLTAALEQSDGSMRAEQARIDPARLD